MRVLVLTLMSLLLGSCAYLEADPHFWPGSQHRLRKVSSLEISTARSPEERLPEAPSIARSDWSLVEKRSFSQRVYELAIRDREGKLLLSKFPPEIILEGDTQLRSVTRRAPGIWHVLLEFPAEQSVTKLGFHYGGHRVGFFRQIHFQTHQVDVLNSTSYVLKQRARADGKDTIRIYVDVRDQRGYSIYSREDFDLRLKLEGEDISVSGPYSASGGTFFRLQSLRPQRVGYRVFLDGEELRSEGEVRFLSADRRGPARSDLHCLELLAREAKRPVPKAELVDAYQELVDVLARRYEESFDGSDVALERLIGLINAPACLQRQIFDESRERASRQLKNVQARLRR